MRPTGELEIRPDEREASRTGLARSCLSSRAVTTPAAYQMRPVTAPQTPTPSPAWLRSIPGLATASSQLPVPPPFSLVVL